MTEFLRYRMIESLFSERVADYVVGEQYYDHKAYERASDPHSYSGQWKNPVGREPLREEDFYPI